LIDANGVDIYLKTLERGESLPLLLVSPNSLDPGIYTLSLHFASVVLSSPWTIGALLLSTLFCCLENAPKPRWVKRGAASGVAVVFLSAFLVIETNLVNGFSVFADADHDRPLRFGQFEFDFGTVLKERLEPRVIRLKNYSDTPIEIKEIRRNCGCLTPTPEKTDIAAGEEIEIDISFSTIVEGPNSYVIEVIGSEGNSAKCRIVFDGRSNIELVPSKHMLGAISRADDAEAVFDVEVQLAYVYDRIIRSIEVGEISSDQPLDCSVGKLFGDSNQHALLKVSVNPDVTRTGFVFQEIPMVVDLGTEQVHLSFEVGADFVE
jgi:hypothetical protein